MQNASTKISTLCITMLFFKFCFNKVFSIFNMLSVGICLIFHPTVFKELIKLQFFLCMPHYFIISTSKNIVKINVVTHVCQISISFHFILAAKKFN